METLKEAYYYNKAYETVECILCPHYCKIKNNQTGICKTRINKNGVLYSTSFANPVAIHIDPIEKKPLYHFFPGSKTFSIATNGCNLRCLNCQNSSISQKSPDIIKNNKFLPENIVKLVLENNCNSISYTYTDPVVYYEYTSETAKIAKTKNIKNIIVSAGYINEKPLLELVPFIDAANIDLKVFDNVIYKKLTGASLPEVLNTLKILLENNIWLEITNLIIPEWTDDLKIIEKMCIWLKNNGFENTPLHFSKFSPLHKLSNLPSTPFVLLNKIHEIALKCGLKYVYLGNVWNSNEENTFCPECNKMLIKRNAYNIIFNEITDNKCPECGTIINGKWF